MFAILLSLVVLQVDLVDVPTKDSRWRLDIKYATTDNFTHQQLYPVARCLLRSDVAAMLKKAQNYLDKNSPGYSFLLKDCYRPERIQHLMWDVVKGTPAQNYVKNPKSKTGSVHNYGAAVDLTLQDKDGKEVDMGTPYDFLGPLAEPRLENFFLQKKQLTEIQLQNRRMLRDSMVQGGGFLPLKNEWWHFDALQGAKLLKKYQKLDIPFDVITAAQIEAPASPEFVWGELFVAVQMQRLFADGKTFVDAIPKKNVAQLVDEYLRQKNDKDFSLRAFVLNNFLLPQEPKVAEIRHQAPLQQHIAELWPLLRRTADTTQAGGSLLPLPHPYIVPGGRFREVYYWDSYFTLLGLAESGQWDLVQNMVQNFAYLIETYGFVPNGNRSYYLSRSQPPFFALMVELLAQRQGDDTYTRYLPILEKEYAYWMRGAEHLQNGQAALRVVRLPSGEILNRYWDEQDTPRPESYREDVELGKQAPSEKTRREMYRDIRSAAASGWDFSSRWFSDKQHLSTIETTSIVPVDLNSLLYLYENVLQRAYAVTKNVSQERDMTEKVRVRGETITRFFWDNTQQFFFDVRLKDTKPTPVYSAAALFPLFSKIATQGQADAVATRVEKLLLKPGGLVTTTHYTGQQWDAPNGWAPLQWVAVVGLENYGHTKLAQLVARRWMKLVEDVYSRTGRLMEKYDVEDLSHTAGGGEYPAQDGFGWTNGVYLKMKARFQ